VNYFSNILRERQLGQLIHYLTGAGRAVEIVEIVS
jgi:hypothetical protein